MSTVVIAVVVSLGLLVMAAGAALAALSVFALVALDPDAGADPTPGDPS